LRIYSITNPAAPILLGRFAGAANARSVAVAGSVAYVGDGQYGLKILDVANPSVPVLKGTYVNTNLNSIRNVGATGSLVLVSDGRNVLLLNTATPSNPTLVGTYTPPGFALSMVVAEGKAYLACGNAGLVILNIAESGLSFLGRYASPHYTSGVAISGNRTYLAHPEQGWEIVDVSNPASPVTVKEATAQGPVHALAASGGTVTLATSSHSAVAVDASVPLTPVPVRTFGPIVQAMRVAASSTAAITAEDEAGLALFANTDDQDGDGLPDWFEQPLINLSAATNGPIHTVWDVRPNDDFDGDGTSNQAEYLAGTSPVDDTSVFMMALQPASGTSGMSIRWYSVPGKTYTIYKSTDLKAGFSVFKDNILATPPINEIADDSASGTAFYFIGVR
ncbi:MAG TPA: hypothetical protein VEC99_07930, partial [Clostridia bacterium]|nr:hypothetical protein [Clostridia bacterium]